MKFSGGAGVSMLYKECILCFVEVLFRSNCWVFFLPTAFKSVSVTFFCHDTWLVKMMDVAISYPESFHSLAGSVWTKSWETCWNSIIWEKSMGQNMWSSITIDFFGVLFGAYPKNIWVQLKNNNDIQQSEK